MSGVERSASPIRRANRKASKYAGTKAMEEVNKAMELWGYPSRFQLAPRFVPTSILSDEDRLLGFYIVLDF